MFTFFQTDNPIFISAVTSFQNPMYNKDTDFECLVPPEHTVDVEEVWEKKSEEWLFKTFLAYAQINWCFFVFISRK